MVNLSIEEVLSGIIRVPDNFSGIAIGYSELIVTSVDMNANSIVMPHGNTINYISGNKEIKLDVNVVDCGTTLSNTNYGR